MYDEIKDAVNFVLSYLYDKIPRRKTNLFGEQLANFILGKFQGRWDVKNPTNDSDFRALRINEKNIGWVDPVFISASNSVGLDLTEVLELLPLDLTIYINPGNVYYRIGSEGIPSLLTNGQLNWSFPCPTPPNSPFKVKLTENGHKPMFELCGSTDPKLTADSFARTRFGTTNKRTGRLVENTDKHFWSLFG